MYVNPTSQEKSDEARINAEAIAERRRASRMKRKFVSQATPWAPGIPSVPVDVVIEDISEHGAGLIYEHPMGIGVPHLLAVPRGEEEGKPIIREYIVVRCSKRHDGKYSIGLELSLARDKSEEKPKKRVCSSRLKLLFLLFGIFGLIIASLAPLGN